MSNRFYLGFGIGFTDLDYNLTTNYDEYASDNSRDNWYLDNFYGLSGTGFNFKFGAIVRPVDFMRIGVAFHTPTFYNINESFAEGLD